MSSPMYDVPEHSPITINADGQGPETDEDKIVATVCWTDNLPWPCPSANAPTCPVHGELLSGGDQCWTCFSTPDGAL